MTFFDFLDKFGYYFKRFILPTIFLIVGIVLLVLALAPSFHEANNGDIISIYQGPGFLYSSLFFLMASLVWFLYLFNVVNSTIGYGIMGIMAICSAILIYSDYTNVKTTVEFKNSFDEMDLNIKARMNDIKQAELAYKEFYGHYTNSVDDLIVFVKTGKKMRITKNGSVPDRKITPEERDYLYNDDRAIDKLMNEIEATALTKSPIAAADLKGFERDTSFIPVLEAVFLDGKRVEAREKIGSSLAFNIDSLGFVPQSNILVKIDTASATVGESTKVPTLYIEMVHPLSNELVDSVFYSIGSLTTNQLNESWKD